MKIKNHDIYIHAQIDYLKYIDADKLMRALRKHIDWSKSGMEIPYKYNGHTKVCIDITPDYVEVYF